MKNSHTVENRSVRLMLLAACAAVLAVALLVALAQPARADRVPAVPDNIQVPAGNKLFLQGHATGTQNYICLPSATSTTGFAWTLFTPQATLFKGDEQIITHFFSPNPNPNPPENGTIRPTWQHSVDTSKVWAKGSPAHTSSDPAFVAPGAIPWLLLEVVGTQAGPSGGDKLLPTTYIQRLNTSGGVAPSTGCATIEDVGHSKYVPYTADYYFYKAE